MTQEPLRTRIPQPFVQICYRVPSFSPKVMFDVGANVGQSSQLYASVFPDADIYFFEPVPASFDKAVNLLEGNTRVHGVMAAVSDRVHTVSMSAHGTSTGNRIKPVNDGRMIDVPAITLDRFCKEASISHIDFLKIDVEGHELEVLRGARETLSVVDFLQIEVGMNRENTYHVSFAEMSEAVEPLGFDVFLVSKQMYERARPVLNRADVVYINRRVYS